MAAGDCDLTRHGRTQLKRVWRLRLGRPRAGCVVTAFIHDSRTTIRTGKTRGVGEILHQPRHVHSMLLSPGMFDHAAGASSWEVLGTCVLRLGRVVMNNEYSASVVIGEDIFADKRFLLT